MGGLLHQTGALSTISDRRPAPFLNVAFTNTFLVVYMLCILLFTDNLLHVHRPPQPCCPSWGAWFVVVQPSLVTALDY